jgi:hypothetical protein
MYSDAEARQTVRELVKSLEAFSARSGGLAFVVARSNPQEYERILDSAKRAEEFIGKPMMAADPEFKNVYAALDNPESNWCDAIRAMLKPGERTWFGAEAKAQMDFMSSLYERFDEEERKAKEGQKGDPGIGS